MTSATAQARANVDDVSNDISKCVECVGARDDAWAEETARGARDQPYRNFERRVGRVRSPTASRLSQICRSAQDDLCGTFKIVIGAMFAAVMQTVVVCVV